MHIPLKNLLLFKKLLLNRWVKIYLFVSNLSDTTMNFDIVCKYTILHRRLNVFEEITVFYSLFWMFAIGRLCLTR